MAWKNKENKFYVAFVELTFGNQCVWMMVLLSFSEIIVRHDDAVVVDFSIACKSRCDGFQRCMQNWCDGLASRMQMWLDGLMDGFRKCAVNTHRERSP